MRSTIFVLKDIANNDIYDAVVLTFCKMFSVNKCNSDPWSGISYLVF
jgi:hypothetical protein